jgi:hypothetical protein
MAWRAVLLLFGVLGAASPAVLTFPNPASPGTVTVAEAATINGVRILAGRIAVLRTGDALETGSGGRAELLAGPAAIVRLGENTSVFLAHENALEIRRGQVLVEVLADRTEPAPVFSAAGFPASFNDAGIYIVNADTKEIDCYAGKLSATWNGRDFTLPKGSAFEIATGQTARLDRGAIKRSSLFAWSKSRSRFLAASSEPAAQLLIARFQAWSGLGWYWNESAGTYTFLPSDGEVTGPFGEVYTSPFEEYAPRRPFLW